MRLGVVGSKEPRLPIETATKTTTEWDVGVQIFAVAPQADGDKVVCVCDLNHLKHYGGFISDM